MSERKKITARDAYIMVEALTFTIEALSGLPIELRPDNNITDMKRLIEDFVRQAHRNSPLRKRPSRDHTREPR